MADNNTVSVCSLVSMAIVKPSAVCNFKNKYNNLDVDNTYEVCIFSIFCWSIRIECI